MAHPSINIISEPSPICYNSAYNCVKYEFQSNLYRTSIGTFAEFVFDFSGLISSSIAPGELLNFAGNSYVTSATTNSYTTVNTSSLTNSTAAAAIIKDALSFNSKIFETFNVVVSGVNDDILTYTARQIGYIADFTFVVTSLIAAGITLNTTNPTNSVYLPNYRLIVEIWEVEANSGGFLNILSKESYIPKYDGLFSINIGQKIATLIETRFVHALVPSSGHFDTTISTRIALRYGEVWSDSGDSCSVDLKNFATTDSVLVINSAFQRGTDVEKISRICAGEFMTNAPDFSEMCEDSIGYLWICADNIFATPVPPNISYRPFFEIFYSDGTSTIHIGASVSTALNQNVLCIQSGFKYISFYANPLKKVDYYRVRFVKRDSSLPIPTGDTYYGDKYFKLISCCKGQLEFYFLNEWGGYDTITMSQINSIELQQETSIFDGFLDCDDDMVSHTGSKGKGIVNQSARDVFEATSSFLDTYQARLWLREFLTSPIKYIRTTIGNESEIFSKIVLLEGSVKYYSKDDNSLFLTFQYTLNEDINLQKN